ncbi:MAG TPA: hypothetical protein VMG62_00050, partial [Solirubrobacteraceae bacterium]|nr:hypothetical protein [Solirubrobacteraceae bacterium]
YGRPGTRFFALVLAYFPLSLLALLVAIRRPRLALRAAALTPLAFAAAALPLRRDRATVASLAWVGPSWLIAMCSGMWYGLWLVLRDRLKARQSEARQSEARQSEAHRNAGGTDRLTA